MRKNRNHHISRKKSHKNNIYLESIDSKSKKPLNTMAVLESAQAQSRKSECTQCDKEKLKKNLDSNTSQLLVKESSNIMHNIENLNHTHHYSNISQQTITNHKSHEYEESYFEILGFEQESTMQIVQTYATQYNIELSLPKPLLQTSNNSLLSQEYGIVARGQKDSLQQFFTLLESLFGEKFLKGNIVEFFLQKLATKSLSLCVAESCTGGMISSLITSINGSSKVYKGGVTAYSIEAKHRILGIKDSVFKDFGVYSEECVKAMAYGALELFHADVALATSGLATQDTSSNNFLKLPAGVVFICVFVRGKMPLVISQNFLSIKDDIATNNKEDLPSHNHTSSLFFANIHNPNIYNPRICVQQNASIAAIRLALSALAN